MLKKFFIAISSIFIITSCATMPTKEDTAISNSDIARLRDKAKKTLKLL